MKKVVFYGHLRSEFGPGYSFDVKTPAEAIRAMEANFPGKFYRALREGRYRVGFSDTGRCIPEELLTMGTGSEEIHIEPVVAGAGGKSGGAILAIIGIALIAVAIVVAPPVGAAGAGAAAGFGTAGASAAAAGTAGGLSATAFTVLGTSISYGQIALVGASLALSGVSSILTPVPKLNSSSISARERPEDRPSFFFNGPVNTSEQGGWAPVVFGRFRTGSVVVSGDIKIQKMV